MLNFYAENTPKEDIEEIKKDLEAEDLNIPVEAIKSIQNTIQMDCMAIKARMRTWKDLERRLVKRIQFANKQMSCIKSVVGQDQQAAIDLKTDID